MDILHCVGMQLLDMDSDSGDQIEHYSLAGMQSAPKRNRRYNG